VPVRVSSELSRIVWESAIVRSMSSRLLKRDKIGILEGLPLFENCTKRELGQLATITTESDRKPGQYLTYEGHEGGLMFVIVEGQAEVLSGTSGHKEKVIGKLGPGEVVGELSLIDGQARSASVRAVTPVRLLEITSEDFRSLVDNSPKFVRNLLRALSIRVRQMDALTN
jgi:CRP/FNR family cyclic AMP-dependent transcriptional regulator